ncbi:MAG: hypothetical protein Q7K57_20490 [Burkholderiaceae bacterium]|nr:hypothetical protein [Burkholderiaceae bacterium]
MASTNSFFSRIRSYFKDKNDGRYLAFILAEIHNRHSGVMVHLLHRALGISKRSLQSMVLVPEYRYDGVRRADLAVFADADAVEPVVLIEIKYLDKFLPGQAAAYARWAQAGTDRHALVLSRELLKVSGMTTMTWTQVATELGRVRNASELADALIGHLEEEGIVMQNIQARPLAGFLRRLLCAAQGAGTQSGNLDGPQEFGKLLRNTKLLSDRFSPLFKEAWRHSGKHAEESALTKSASIDFQVVHNLKDGSLGRSSATGGSRTSAIEDRRNGGTVKVFARHALGSGGNWLRVSYGFSIDVKPGADSTSPTVSFITWANGQNVSRKPARKKLSFQAITSKAETSMDRFDVILTTQLSELIEDILAGTTTSRQRIALKHLQKSIALKAA